MYDEEYEEYEFSEEELEEIERKANGPEGYSEELQYVRRTHVTKEEGVKNKEEAARRGNWSTHSFMFQEMVEWHRKGLTLRHLPPKVKHGPWSTRYLFLDIDNKPMDGHDAPDITPEEMGKALSMTGYEGTGFTGSTSGMPYKYHCFFFLSTPVRTGDEYVEAREEADRRLREAMASIRGTSSFPHLCDPEVYWQSSLFAPPGTESVDVVLKDWTIDETGLPRWAPDLPHRERTKDSPSPRYRTGELPDATVFHDWLVPLTNSGFARWLRNTGIIEYELIEDMEFAQNLSGMVPYLRRGASKLANQIGEGERHVRINNFMVAFYAQWRAFNLWLDVHGFPGRKFTEEDLSRSFGYYMDRSYENCDGYRLEPHLEELRNHMSRYRSRGDREYLEAHLDRRYVSGRTVYRTRTYTAETANHIIDSLEEAGRVAFESARFRDSFLKDRRISFPTLKKVAESRGVAVVTLRSSAGGSRGGAGRKPSVSWEELAKKGEMTEGTFFYREKLSPSERKTIQRKGLKIKKIKLGQIKSKRK